VIHRPPGGHDIKALWSHHIVLLNPVLSVRGERYAVAEGKNARKSNLVGLRHRPIIAILMPRAVPWRLFAAR
jgi:hypothetical protein